MRLPTPVRLGIGAIVIAAIVFVGAKSWLKTRNYVLVDIPANLSRGRIVTGKFKINQRASYSILIVTNDPSSPSCYVNSILQTRRLTSVGGRPVDGLDRHVAPPGQDVTFGAYLGTLEGVPGEYSLEIEVLSDASCLNVGHPRLLIEATRRDYQERRERYDLACLASLVMRTLGVLLLIVGISGARRSRSRARDDPLGIL
jgi:hypothetical protein